MELGWFWGVINTAHVLFLTIVMSIFVIIMHVECISQGLSSNTIFPFLGRVCYWNRTLPTGFIFSHVISYQVVFSNVHDIRWANRIHLIFISNVFCHHDIVAVMVITGPLASMLTFTDSACWRNCRRLFCMPSCAERTLFDRRFWLMVSTAQSRTDLIRRSWRTADALLLEEGPRCVMNGRHYLSDRLVQWQCNELSQ